MPHCFVGLARNKKGKSKKTYLYKENRTTKVKQVLWGDWLNVESEESDGWLKIKWGPNSDNPQTYYIPKEHTSETRPLEIIFLDVGQGDGAVLITPERDGNEAIIVIDAGINENMHAFLSKRFKPYNNAMQFHAAIITHPDEDHYAGFETIFATHAFGFDMIYHNGLIERPVSGQFEKLGGLKRNPDDKRSYIENLAIGKSEIENTFGNDVDLGRFEFPKVMNNALNNPNIKDFAMLSTEHGIKENGRTWMPGFAPSDNRDYDIEVIGPVVEFDSNDEPRLRKIGGYGETKNGHSVLLRLHYGDFKVLFGGDLNDKAEKFLLAHYAGMKRFSAKGKPSYEEMRDKAAEWFGADIMKVCHHGSEKVTDEFIETVSPAAFIISSGDEEGHVHPRPDLLGRLGKLGRSKSPVILSTELQRSTRDSEDEKLVRSLYDKVLKISDNPTKKLRDQILEDLWTLGRSNVTVYGTIYLKTDGEKLIAAFRIETGSEKKKWFTFEYEFDDSGNLNLVT